MHIRLKPQRGFTLIELMITVAIVAIIAAIAFPNYTRYVQRGYRSEGIATLNDAVARMERYYAQNNSYRAADLIALGFANATPASETGKYQLRMTTATDTAYTFQVVPQGAQASDSCGTLTINQAGAKTPDPATTNCWK